MNKFTVNVPVVGASITRSNYPFAWAMIVWVMNVTVALMGLLGVELASAAVFTVQNLDDSGTGSLRQAILDANANAEDDSIVFNGTLTGTITLTGTQLEVTSTMTIEGDKRITINGGGNSRAILVNAGGNLTLNDVTITNGNPGSFWGGGLRVQGTGVLTVNYSTIVGNTSSAGGGGVAAVNGGTAILNNSTVSGNTSGASAGGVLAGGSPGGSATLNNVTVLNNTANNIGSGVIPETAGSTITLNNSIVADSDAFIDCAGVVTVNNSLIQDGSCGATLTGDPLLGAATGSPAYFPITGSSNPAVLNTGDNSLVVGSIDQAGNTRTVGAAVDLGSVEFASPPPPACPTTITFPAGGNWSMIGLGCDLSTPGATVADVFGDDLGTANYDITWVMYSYNPDTDAYSRLATTATLSPTEGYWIYTAGAATTSVEGTANPAQDLTVRGDSSGKFNLVGNFYPNDICWRDAEFDDGGSFVSVQGQPLSCATNNPDPTCKVSSSAWRWNGAAYETFNATVIGTENTINAGEGVWVRFFSNTQLRLIDAGPCPGTRARLIPGEWYQRLSVSADGMMDGFSGNVLGQSQRSVDGIDAMDLPDLPPSFSPFLALTFPKPEWGTYAGDYNTDFRALEQDIEEYAFEVRSNQARTITLRWEDPYDQLSRVILVDVESGDEIQPTAGGEYTTTMVGTRHRFIWRVDQRQSLIHQSGFESPDDVQ